MKLIYVRAENFGTLKSFSLSFVEGLNAYCIENGAGKSTLIAFLKCMLYGLSESRSHDLSENERKHYLPWQGGTFGGTLILEHENTVLRIVRRFGARPAEDTLEVFEEESGKPTDVLGKIPGQTIFGMDAEGFSICSVFSERDYAPRLENESMIARMGSEDSIRGAKDALERLAEERRIYEKKGAKGLLYEIEDALSQKKEKHEILTAEAKELPERERAFLSAKASLAALSEQRPRGDLPKKSARTAPHGGILPFSLALLFSVLSFALSGVFKYALLGLLPAAFLLCIGIYLVFVKSRLHFSKKEAERSKPKSAEAIDQKSDFEERYRICTACARAYEAALAAKEDAALLCAEIEALEKKRERIRTHLSDIKKTEALLARAADRYREKRASLAHAFFSEHLHALGAQDAKGYRMDERFSVSFLENEAYRTANALSRGQRDLVSLARSLALASALPGAEKLPLLLDDPFLSFDDERLAIALSSIEALAKERQILYLTCSHSRMP